MENVFFNYFILKAGLPAVYYVGMEGDYNIMVMELLGPSLEDLFSLCNKKFSLKTVLMIADQIVSRVEYIQSRGYIHRDIKPDNFVIGLGKKSTLIYALDFGLSKRYKDIMGKHIEYKDGKSLTGTARYTSINTHLGCEQSRRDDLESVCYVLLYFLKGSLPWQGIPNKNRHEKYQMIMKRKMEIPIEELCNGTPIELMQILKYCKNLRFEEDPDYTYIKGQLKNMFINNAFDYDFIFDWDSLIPKKNSPAIGGNSAKVIKETKKLYDFTCVKERSYFCINIFINRATKILREERKVQAIPRTECKKSPMVNTNELVVNFPQEKITEPEKKEENDKTENSNNNGKTQQACCIII